MLRSTLFLFLFLPACQSGPPPVPAATHTGATLAATWRSTPADGVEVVHGEPLTVRSTPHAVLWPDGAAPERPPYTVRASLRKRQGRLHEGFGLVFGGEGLERPEVEQRYSYFLVRGDGSFLIKRRDRGEAPVVRPWTSHPAIRRDVAGTGEANTLEVDIGEAEVVFRVNGTEVTRVPTADLHTHGVAGLRISHGVELEVGGWTTGRSTPRGRG